MRILTLERAVFICGLVAVLPFTVRTALAAEAEAPFFTPGNLIVSRSVYEGTAATVTIGELLPPNCPQTATCGGVNNAGVPATDDGAYPAIGVINPSTGNLQNVWNNAIVDGSFGVTSPIFLDQITTGGTLVNTLAIDPTQIVTSFSSKSELALNLSTDGTLITFMGYVNPLLIGSSQINQIDVSNSNTPGVIDPTNPVSLAAYRSVAQVDAFGNLQITATNAYSGNNGRASIFSNGASGTGLYYMVGNSNNGSGTPANVVASTGVETIAPSDLPLAEQNPGNPTMVGSFSITQINPLTGEPYAAAPDKLGKDNNFRGLTLFDNTIFVTKGSGSNGINTAYQVGNAGILPTLATAADTPIDVLPGFNTILAKTATKGPNPFGIWYANPTTLYVADEGDGTAADAATSPWAGLEKWSLVNGIWTLDYVLTNGLNLGVQYSVPNYPPSLYPATDGLRSIAARLDADGTATIWAVTSTVSTNGDEGADPNLLVAITDVVAATTLPTNEQFTVVKAANYGEVLRGVSFTQGTTAITPPNLPVTMSGLYFSRITQTYSGTITVVNNTSSAVSGPLQIVLTNLTSGVTVTGNPPIVDGWPAVPILASGATLNPGQSASAEVAFSNPSNALINFTAEVVP
jgi:hypothetical protein